jgi:hypothetical protein
MTTKKFILMGMKTKFISLTRVASPRCGPRAKTTLATFHARRATVQIVSRRPMLRSVTSVMRARIALKEVDFERG